RILAIAVSDIETTHCSPSPVRAEAHALVGRYRPAAAGWAMALSCTSIVLVLSQGDTSPATKQREVDRKAVDAKRCCDHERHMRGPPCPRRQCGRHDLQVCSSEVPRGGPGGDHKETTQPLQGGRVQGKQANEHCNRHGEHPACRGYDLLAASANVRK